METPSPHQSPSPSKVFSPIIVPESPLSSTPGQLTGIPRRVRDAAADLFNAIQAWNSLHIEGMGIIHQIKNKKLDEIEKLKSPADLYPEGLQELCDQLDIVCSKLEPVLLKIETTFKNFKAIKNLQEMKHIVKPIFITWADEKYVAGVIFDGFNKEILLKKYIQENLAHARLKEDVMLYCALWAHQPYIEKEFDFLLEAMLKETGHR